MKIKLRTKKSASKRFTPKGNGKAISRKRAYKNHILEKKGQDRKRRLRATGSVHASDMRRVKRLLKLM